MEALYLVLFQNYLEQNESADGNNLIDAARCLLIEDGNQLILIDTGMGDKQSEKILWILLTLGLPFLDKSLAKYGFSR
jgi:glyoxylase-like metal-dependent hydrolase (beta-lactamase superfamily II)